MRDGSIRVDYARLRHQYARHHERYARHVEKHGLMCQDCGGIGSYVADSFDFGDAESGAIMFDRREECGWCEGTGKVTRHTRGLWLRIMKQEKRRKGNA